jgi:hypothetical protein
MKEIGRAVLLSFVLSLSVVSQSLLGDDGTAGVGPGSLFRLYFIHLSCGENWLADGDGGLRKAIENAVTENGHRFRVFDSSTGNADHCEWTERFNNNDDWEGFDIVMFKSCFPASHIDSTQMLKAYKKVYRKWLMKIFKAHPDILFIIVTAPPLVPNSTDQPSADRARQFNNWLVIGFIKKYNKKNPGFNNVAVFDFFNVLANASGTDRNMLKKEYRIDEWDSHPNPKGNKEATEEFIPFLRTAVDNWADGGGVPARIQGMLRKQLPGF